MCAQGGNLSGGIPRSRVAFPVVFPWPGRFPEAGAFYALSGDQAAFQFCLRLRRTVKTIFPVGVLVSTCSQSETKFYKPESA